ncbi:TPA: TolC family outer membrane protein [Pseudomonas aeruginosa]|nr:TolC family outer membrane protein [Pseudomonas aeruginosa]HEE6759895.1 TolC family outer membrane protein [Pseudomonas aeruginosa]
MKKLHIEKGVRSIFLMACSVLVLISRNALGETEYIVKNSDYNESTNSGLASEYKKAKKTAVHLGLSERKYLGEVADLTKSGSEIIRIVQKATSWNPSIKSASESIQEQLQFVEVARSGYYPKIQGGLKTGYDSSFPKGGNSQQFELTASQVLYDFGKVSGSVETSLAGVDQREAEARLSIDKVILDTASAYLEVQRYQQLVDIAKKQIINLKSVSELARRRTDLGASNHSDYVQTASRIEGAKVVELQYSANLERWRSTLLNLLGEARLKPVTNDFPQVLEMSCQTPSADIQENPEVQAAQARAKAVRSQAAEARAAGLPTVSLDPILSHRLSGDPGFDQDRTRYGVFINVTMPIYQGGSIVAGQAASERAAAAAQANLDNTRLNAMQGLQQNISQQKDLQLSLLALSSREKTIVETREIYRQQYQELGSRPLLDLLNAEQEVFQSHADHQNTLSNLRLLKINCLFQQGLLRSAFDIERDSN